MAPFVGHGELPAGQLALAEDILAAQGRARGEGAGQGARQYGVDQGSGLQPLIVAVQHQPADGHTLADGKLPKAENGYRTVGTGPLQHRLFADMFALLVDERVVEAEEDRLIATLPGVEHRLLPQAVVTEQLAVDPGLADPQFGLGLEFILDGGERHVAGIKQHQRFVESPHQLAHFADVAFEQRPLQHAGDLGVADKALEARVLVHAKKHHRGAQRSDLVGQIVDGIVIAQHHQIRFALEIEGDGLLGNVVKLLPRVTLGIHIEVGDLVFPLQTIDQPFVVALVPQVFGMVAADHQNVGGP